MAAKCFVIESVVAPKGRLPLFQNVHVSFEF